MDRAGHFADMDQAGHFADMDQAGRVAEYTVRVGHFAGYMDQVGHFADMDQMGHFVGYAVQAGRLNTLDNTPGLDHWSKVEEGTGSHRRDWFLEGHKVVVVVVEGDLSKGTDEGTLVAEVELWGDRKDPGKKIIII